MILFFLVALNELFNGRAMPTTHFLFSIAIWISGKISLLKLGRGGGGVGGRGKGSRTWKKIIRIQKKFHWPKPCTFELLHSNYHLSKKIHKNKSQKRWKHLLNRSQIQRLKKDFLIKKLFISYLVNDLREEKKAILKKILRTCRKMKGRSFGKNF